MEFSATVKEAARKGKMSTLTPTLAESRASVACLTLRTGRSDCIAQFYPALYQLDLVRDGQVERIDLGFPEAECSSACCKRRETWSPAMNC